MLDLQHNRLSSLDAGDFRRLAKLTELYLGGNQLTSPEAGVFSNLKNLTILDLSGNALASLDAGTFSGLANLTRLELAGNRLSSLEAGTFGDLTNLAVLVLQRNALSRLAAGAFQHLANLKTLELEFNELSNLETGALSGLANLTTLDLRHNTALTDLNLAEANFSNLTGLSVGDDGNITRVSLRNTVVNQTALAALLSGGIGSRTGIGELGGITEMDLSGVDFATITDLSPLYVLDDLSDLWLVDTLNLDAADLDVLLDNLATIEGTATEGILHLTRANFDAFGALLAAWDAELGHHVDIVPEPAGAVLGILALVGLPCWRRKGRGRCHATWPNSGFGSLAARPWRPCRARGERRAEK